MTRVNLLRSVPGGSASGSARSASRRRGAAACALLLALTSCGLSLWARDISEASSRLTRDLAAAQRALAIRRTQSIQADAARLGTSELQKRVEQLEALRVSQQEPVRLLDAISRALPEDCWLTAITDEGAGAVRIEGRGPALASVFAFAEQLQGSSLFSGGVEVLESHTSRDTDEEVIAFSLRGFRRPRGAAAATPASPQKTDTGARVRERSRHES